MQAALPFLWLAFGAPIQAKDAGGRAASAALSQIRTGHFTVLAVANGQPVRLVVDTACPVTVFTESAYRRLKVADTSLALPSGVRPLRSLNGHPTDTGYIADLRIGGASLGGLRVAVAGLDAVLGGQFAGGGGGVDGILGTDVLARYGAVIDLRRGTLAVHPSHAERKGVAQQAARADYTVVPMAPTNGGHLAVPCIVRDEPGRLVVDTGSPYTVIERGVVAPDTAMRPSQILLMHTLGGTTAVSWVPLEHWSIGTFPVTRASVGAGNFRGGIFAEHTRSGGQVIGLFGLEWLSRWGAVIDFGSRTLYLKHP